jgi:hypothetical protein
MTLSKGGGKRAASRLWYIEESRLVALSTARYAYGRFT